MVNLDRAYSCIASMSEQWRSRCVVIDNLGYGPEMDMEIPGVAKTISFNKNLGVAASWNLGVKYAQSVDASHLIIVSESIRFNSMEFCDLVWSRPGLPLNSVYAFHLTGIPIHLFDVVGLFDEDFYPAYFEDTDWMYRCMINGSNPGSWERDDGTTHTVHDSGFAHSLTSGVVSINFGNLFNLYIEKHGGKPGEELW